MPDITELATQIDCTILMAPGGNLDHAGRYQVSVYCKLCPYGSGWPRVFWTVARDAEDAIRRLVRTHLTGVHGVRRCYHCHTLTSERAPNGYWECTTCQAPFKDTATCPTHGGDNYVDCPLWMNGQPVCTMTDPHLTNALAWLRRKRHEWGGGPDGEEAQLEFERQMNAADRYEEVLQAEIQVRKEAGPPAWVRDSTHGDYPGALRDGSLEVAALLTEQGSLEVAARVDQWEGRTGS